MNGLNQIPDSIEPERSTVPIKGAWLESLAEWCLFPSIIITAMLSNQLLGGLPNILGRVFGWITIFAASVIIISSSKEIWPRILVLFVLISKVVQVGEIATLGYPILSWLLLCLAGAILFVRLLNLVYKQTYIICLLNVVFMFMQTAGIADWSQFLTTHYQYYGDVFYPVAFFNETIFFDVTQRRPAGLLYSNQYLAMITLFGSMVHFSRKNGRFATGALVMCIMCVLSMSKIVLVGVILLFLFLLIFGNSYQRREILRGITLIIFLILLYGLLFPGLFRINMSVSMASSSITTRLGNILFQYDPNSAAFLALQDFSKEQQLGALQNPDWEDRITGYVDLISILPFVTAAAIIALPFYIRGLIRVHNWFPNLTTMSVVAIILALIIPAAGPLWRAPVYSFMSGFALLPLFIIFQPRQFKTFKDH